MAVPTAIRRASLEKDNAQADPPAIWGRLYDTKLLSAGEMRVAQAAIRLLASAPSMAKSCRP